LPLPSTTQILNGQSPANNEPVRVTSPPGAEVRYSGGGYVVVQQLVTGVAGQPFDRYMRDTVFAPLGMDDSWFEQPLSSDHARFAASGYRREGSMLAGGFMVHPELAAAGLWTTPSDLARVVITLQDALAGRATQFLKPEMAREMLTANISNAGLGVFLTGPNGPSRRFTHSGRNAGFDGMVVGYKNGRQGAVVMINRNNNEGFITEVLESIAREYQWPDFLDDRPQREYVAVPGSVQAAYAGSYEAAGQSPLMVVYEDDKLFARSGEDAWFRLYPVSPTEFFVAEDSTRWTFVRAADGTVAEVVESSNNGDVRRRRLSAQTRQSGTASETYQSAAIDANGDLTILTTAGQRVIVRKEGEQTAFSRPVISADRTAVAAQALIANCCTSYDIPVQVVVYARGKVHRFTGAGMAIFKWGFADG